MKHRQSIYVKCPYYRFEEKTEIVCESLLENVKFSLCFKTPRELKKYQHEFCMRQSSKCGLMQALDEKLEYRGRNEEHVFGDNTLISSKNNPEEE